MHLFFSQFSLVLSIALEGWVFFLQTRTRKGSVFSILIGPVPLETRSSEWRRHYVYVSNYSFICFLLPSMKFRTHLSFLHQAGPWNFCFCDPKMHLTGWHVGTCSEECAGTGEARFAYLGSSQPFSKKPRTLFIGSFWAMVTRVLCGMILFCYFTTSNHSNTFYGSPLQPNRILQMLLFKTGFICNLRDCLFRFL